MKAFFSSLALSLLFAFVISCGEKAATPASSFTWRYNDSINGSAKSHKGFQSGMGNSPVLIATNDTVFSTEKALIVVKSSSFAVGIYPVTDTGANTLRYFYNDSTSVMASSGNYNITTWYGDAMAGDFLVWVTDTAGIPRKLQGKFRYTPIQK